MGDLGSLLVFSADFFGRTGLMLGVTMKHLIVHLILNILSGIANLNCLLTQTFKLIIIFNKKFVFNI